MLCFLVRNIIIKFFYILIINFLYFNFSILIPRLSGIQNKIFFLGYVLNLNFDIKFLVLDNFTINIFSILHESIGKTLKAATYFTRPYSSQDKGTVENRIGVIRRFLP